MIFVFMFLIKLIYHFNNFHIFKKHSYTTIFLSSFIEYDHLCRNYLRSQVFSFYI